MVKRILTLTIVFLITMIGYASAESVEDNYELLNHLNIISDNYENVVNKKSVSQKEYLESLVKIMSDNKVESGKAIEYAKSQSIISQISTSEMNSGISYERALSLSLNLLGYSRIIEINGNNVSTVLRISEENKLTKGVLLSVGDKLTGKAYITLLANLLEADMVNIKSAKGNEISYAKGNETALFHYMDIIKKEANITHTNETSLYFENGLGDSKIGINDETCIIDYPYSTELLGKPVYAYLKDAGGETVAVHIAIRENKLKQLEIQDEDIKRVADDFQSITYEKANKNTTIKLNPALKVIYNGKFYTEYTKEDLKPINGKIVCLDTDNDDKYDIVFVYSYETIVVKNISTVYKKITNLLRYEGCIENLDLSDDTTDVKIFLNGDRTTISSISVNNVLSVAQSKSNNKLIYIYIGKEKKSGSLKGHDIDEKSIEIDEDKFSVSGSYYNALLAPESTMDELKIGNYYTFYFDNFGKVAFVKIDSKAGYEYAFILKQKWNNKTDTSKLRILTTDDEWEYVELAERVKFNDANKQDAEIIYNELGREDLIPQLVLIKKNEEGKIVGIKTATVSTTYQPNKFTKTSQINKRYYWSGDSSFNCRHYLKYDAVVLLKPSDDTKKYDEDEYSMTTSGYFEDWKAYTYVAYNVDEFGYPEAFEVKDTNGTKSQTIYVNKVIVGINEDDEPIKKVIANYSGIENLAIPEKVGAIKIDIKSGDIAQIKLRNGKILDIAVDFSINSPKELKAPVDDYKIHDGETKVMGFVKNVDPERKMLLLDCGTETLPMLIHKDADIEIYNAEKKQFEIGSVSDICEGNYARIVMGNNQISSVVIFQ